MDVSVIIPAYNTDAYIAKAVRSVLLETGLLLEVIVVDDASTDRTSQVVEELSAQDTRVRLVRQLLNMGPSYCRNRGLDEARGRYVAFVDADDWCAPNRLDQLVRAADAADADAVSDNVHLIDPGMEAPWADLHTEAGVTYTNGDTLRVPEFIRVGWVVHPVIRRAFLETHHLRFDPAVDYGEDYILYTQMMLRGCRWIVWSDPLYFHLARPGSITHSSKLPEDLVRYLSSMAREMRAAGQPDFARAFRYKRDRTAASVTLRNMVRHYKLHEYRGAVVAAVRMVRYTKVYAERFVRLVQRRRLKQAVPQTGVAP